MTKMDEDLLELKSKVTPLIEENELSFIEVNERCLKRYLQAFKCPDVAFERLLESNSWRGDFGVAKLNEKTPGVKNNQKDKKGMILDEFDKSGRPIIYIAARNHSIFNRNLEELVQFIVYLLEEACKHCNEELADNLCLIFDLQKFSISCMDYALINNLLWALNRHYPERLGVCYIVSAPLIFTACWAIIQKWMDDRTRSKVRFVSTLKDLAPYLHMSSLSNL